MNLSSFYSSISSSYYDSSLPTNLLKTLGLKLQIIFLTPVFSLYISSYSIFCSISLLIMLKANMISFLSSLFNRNKLLLSLKLQFPHLNDHLPQLGLSLLDDSRRPINQLLIDLIFQSPTYSIYIYHRSIIKRNMIMQFTNINFSIKSYLIYLINIYLLYFQCIANTFFFIIYYILFMKDFDRAFIKKLEEQKLVGYVPGNQSGVTVAIGLDLAGQDIVELRSYKIPESLIAKLSPFCVKELKGDDARKKLDQIGLILTKDQLQILVQFLGRKYGKRLMQILENNGIDYNSLSRAVKTVLFSRVIHSWQLKPQVIQFVKKRQWLQLAQQLGKLKGFGKRGENECDYVKKSL